MRQNALTKTCNVWSSLIVREVSARVVESKYGWLWLILEPLAIVLLVVLAKDAIKSIQLNTAGADNGLWIVLGFMAFFLFRDGMFRGLTAIKGNIGLLGFPVIKPVDLVISRLVADGLVRFVALLALFGLLWFFDYQAWPAQPFEFFMAWIAVWLLGFGAGLFFSALAGITPSVESILKILSLPLLLFSGVFFPIHYMSNQVAEVLAFNPVLQLIEQLRLGFFESYWTLSSIEWGYPLKFAFLLIVAGLVLHQTWSEKIRAV